VISISKISFYQPKVSEFWKFLKFYFMKYKFIFLVMTLLAVNFTYAQMPHDAIYMPKKYGMPSFELLKHQLEPILGEYPKA
jgi:hypothetical protein